MFEGVGGGGRDLEFDHAVSEAGVEGEVIIVADFAALGLLDEQFVLVARERLRPRVNNAPGGAEHLEMWRYSDLEI